jgi:hypothetical protein
MGDTYLPTDITYLPTDITYLPTYRYYLPTYQYYIAVFDERAESVFLTQYCGGGKIEKNQMGGACGAYGRGESGAVLVGKPEIKRPVIPNVLTVSVCIYR